MKKCYLIIIGSILLSACSNSGSSNNENIPSADSSLSLPASNFYSFTDKSANFFGFLRIVNNTNGFLIIHSKLPSDNIISIQAAISNFVPSSSTCLNTSFTGLVNSQNVTGTLQFANCAFTNDGIAADVAIDIAGSQSIKMIISGSNQKPVSVNTLSSMLSTLESQNPTFYNSRFGGITQVQLLSPYPINFTGSPHGVYGKLYNQTINVGLSYVKYAGGSGTAKISLVDSTAGSFEGNFTAFQTLTVKLKRILERITTLAIANKIESTVATETSASGKCTFIIGNMVTNNGLSESPTICTTSCVTTPATSGAACSTLSAQESITLTTSKSTTMINQPVYLTAKLPELSSQNRIITFSSSAQEISPTPKSCTIQANETSCSTLATATQSGAVSYTADTGNFSTGTVNVAFISPDPTPSPEPAESQVIFLSTSTITGNISSFMAADHICENDKPNGDYRIYKAMLVGNNSDGTRTACTTANCSGGTSEHQDWVLQANTSYYNLNESVIYTTNANAIFSAWPSESSPAPGVSMTYAWTGLSSDWTTNTNNCSNWTSENGLITGQMGAPYSITLAQIANGSTACSSEMHLYCISQ